MTSVAPRPELPPMSPRIAKLPVDHRGYPVPWFVSWIDGQADFRVLKPGAVNLAMLGDLCWVCGAPMGRWRTWPIGPMCAVNRVTAEPPAHYDCAVWSAKACPFLTRPHARRRENNLPEDAQEPAGKMIRRNPGAIALWVTQGRPARRAYVRATGLFDVGDPVRVEWMAEGRDATRAEIMASLESGLPILREAAEMDGPRALRALQRQYDSALTLLPAA